MVLLFYLRSGLRMSLLSLYLLVGHCAIAESCPTLETHLVLLPIPAGRLFIEMPLKLQSV